MYSLAPPMNLSRLLWSLLILLTPLLLWVSLKQEAYIIEWEIASLNSVPLTLMLLIDSKSVFFGMTVLFISANIMHFSHYYMQNEVFQKRFVHLVGLFILSMNLLIFIPHMVALLLGWDGLGITSFLLVAYYQNAKSLSAAMITALMNRIGDVMILLSIGWMFNQSHWYIMDNWGSPYAALTAATITLAAMTKSAQIPFSSWLPAAMAAPTPVSALVHSSTLVTAGVFLLIRFYPFLHSIKGFNSILLAIATMTMIMASLSAITECDMKKIIALSTLSQLGVMMMSLGLNMPHLAFFHLITHALFKALLFMCAGMMIHLHHHSQDLRLMGNLTRQLPLTTSCMLIANLALCGSPWLAGFYSKDLIIESSLFSSHHLMSVTALSVATVLTTMYSMRLIITIMWAPNMSLPFQNTSDENTTATTPMIMITLGAILSGAMANWLLFQPMYEPFLPPYMKVLTLLMIMLGMLCGWIFTVTRPFPVPIALEYHHLHNSLSQMWFLSPTTSQGVISSPLMLGHKSLYALDQGFIEMFGPQGLATVMAFLTAKKEQWLGMTATVHLTITFMFMLLLFMSHS